QGSFDKSILSTAQPDNQFEFHATRRLASHEGLSIVLSWPKGLIAPPTTQEKLNYFLTDNHDALVMGADLLLLLLYYLVICSSVGRDRKRGVSMALYEPPANFLPAAMSYLMIMRSDHLGFAA